MPVHIVFQVPTLCGPLLCSGLSFVCSVQNTHIKKTRVTHSVLHTLCYTLCGQSFILCTRNNISFNVGEHTVWTCVLGPHSFFKFLHCVDLFCSQVHTWYVIWLHPWTTHLKYKLENVSSSQYCIKQRSFIFKGQLKSFN